MKRALHILSFSALGCLVLILYLLVSQTKGARAAPAIQEPVPTPGAGTLIGVAPIDLSIADETCLSCHGQPGTTMTLENGETWDLYVPAEAHANSVHGELGYACVQCHIQVGEYPHPSFTAKDSRDASLQLSTACQRCHAQQYGQTMDSVHSTAQEAGNNQAAICSDCHTAHDVQRIYQPRTKDMLLEARVWIPQACARCHSAIYEKYRQSVHGSALIGQGNPDVPTCTNCHGSHTIENPTTAAFRLKSPDICAKCHTDPNVMDRYGISTDVLETYVADFHGTTLVLFEPGSPDAPFNKPVCYDCHGVHDIASKNDPKKSLLVRENLLARCQVCHPDASANFPSAWLSHYIPSPEKYPIVYYVTLFYQIFIPFTLGGMAILVGLDFGRSSLNRIKNRKPGLPGDTKGNLQAVLKRWKAQIFPEDENDLENTQPSDAEDEKNG